MVYFNSSCFDAGSTCTVGNVTVFIEAELLKKYYNIEKMI